MMTVGGAEKGDRTMVDALVFGQEQLQTTHPSIDYGKLSDAVRAGADYAKTIQASKGRSAYLDD